ncbi:TPA: NAD(P)H-dependent oxidoreductase [Candidatus Woesearchaeota archaeon]|nr:NAD(P)H-dependent oxidoreductase [Candidatus Woesearchaeota archaeon]HII68694.1 NAD(P)H-dependent oxidoreductase [Candidatus Woesearchaeota archaeon]
MKPLIIYAHPDVAGHCSLIRDEVLSQLGEKKIAYDFVDLYKEQFDPVLHENELYTAGNRDVSPQAKRYQELIAGTDKIIFIYPVWWNSTPAILKGFFDKVLTSGFAFKFRKSGIPVAFLTGKKAALFVTSGSPTLFYKLFLGDRGVKVVARDTLGFCGIKAREFHVGSARKVKKSHNEQSRGMAAKGLRYLRL